MEDIVSFVSKRVDKGDYVVTMGAGNIWEVANSLVEQSEQQKDDTEGYSYG